MLLSSTSLYKSIKAFHELKRTMSSAWDVRQKRVILKKPSYTPMTRSHAQEKITNKKSAQRSSPLIEGRAWSGQSLSRWEEGAHTKTSQSRANIMATLQLTYSSSSNTHATTLVTIKQIESNHNQHLASRQCPQQFLFEVRALQHSSSKSLCNRQTYNIKSY